MPDKEIVLKEGPPWGFRMTGGKNTGSPLKISRVNNAGKAAKAGVREGFLIETINSASVDHLTSNEAQALIRNSGDTLTIGVYRQSKSNNTGQNVQEHEDEAKACVDINGRPKQAETETTNKKSKRIRKRRRKKKPAESSKNLTEQQSTNLPDKIIDQSQEQIQIEYPKIEIIPANSNLRINELEWIKQNEALLIAELETRRQAGLPIQVVVRVEKITPSMPEYCQIVPDFCHLDIIKEETSASDEDPKKDIYKCPKKIETKFVNNINIISDALKISNVVEEKNYELDSIPEVDLNEPIITDCQLARLESPSLVRESEILRFADIVTTENECVIELETLEPLNNLSLDVKNVENNACTDREEINSSNDNLNNDNTVEDIIINNDNPIQNENIKNQISIDNLITNSISEQNEIITTDRLIDTESYEDSSYEDIFYEKKPIEVHSKNKQIDSSEVLSIKTQLINYSSSTECTHNTNFNSYNEFSKNKNNVKTSEIIRQEIAEHEESSDDSTIKQYETYNHSYKKRCENKVSVYDRLKKIARLLQDDTDDYEEIQSPQTTPRCISLASDTEADTDWVSYTLSDGESAKSLCLSPSQFKSSYAPSTISETSEIIDLHKKFSNRTISSNLSPHQDSTAIDILSYSKSTSPSKSYSSEVIDEACRMCGTSDEPLSDAECLVSLRKYRETRSRLLDVIQKEQQLNRSVIDRPSSMPTFIDTLSVPDNQTRKLMYTEYMEKVKERENRLHNKVIRITKASRPLSSGTLQILNDIDAEFVSKARERLEKLGVEPDVHIEVKDEFYPKHLVDIVPEEEVCIEEVQMNVWPSLITLFRYESAEEVSKISCKCPSL